MAGGDLRRDRPSLFGLHRFAIFWQVSVVFGTAAIGWAVIDLVHQPWSTVRWVSVAPVLLVCLGVVLAELRPLLWASVGDSAIDTGLSLSSGLVLASLFLWGPAMGVLVQVVATLTGELAKAKAPWRVMFNVCQYVLSLGSAALAVELIRPNGLETLVHPMSTLSPAALLWMAPAWLVYHLVNLALVSGVARGGTTWIQDFRTDFWYYSTSTFAVLVLSAVVVALAIDSSWPFIVILAIPTYAIYRASALSWRLHAIAHLDDLTGLQNRRALGAVLVKAFAEADAAGTGVALLLIDLNEFKEVNDSLGHSAGDQLLKIIADRAKRVLRPNDSMLRLGGDEFAVIMSEVPSSGDSGEVAERLRAVIAEPAGLGDTTVSVSASIGIAAYPGHAFDSESLLRRADVAMYRAKANQSGIEVYAEEFDPNSASRIENRNALRTSLARGEVEVHFQPQIELGTGAICGVEALLRWTHNGQRIPPTEILALASQSDLSRALTDYVLVTTLTTIRGLWQQGIRLPVAINISSSELSAHYPRGADLVDHIMRELAAAELPPWALHLEISGDRMLGDRDRGVATLRHLAERGVTASLDDFGAGVASIAVLRKFPLAEVKIDRSLVAGMLNDGRDRTLVLALIDIAHALGLRVVAEGVEDLATADVLREAGCDVAQGFHFAAVLSPVDLDRWLTEQPGIVVSQVRPLRVVGGTEA